MFLQDKEQIIVGPVRIGEWHALAEAIREGCRISPRQCFGHLFDSGASCARGAAYLGGIDLMLYDASDPKTACPACGELCGLTLLHLNDDHRWTRERIADWLDTL